MYISQMNIKDTLSSLYLPFRKYIILSDLCVNIFRINDFSLKCKKGNTISFEYKNHEVFFLWKSLNI